MRKPGASSTAVIADVDEFYYVLYCRYIFPGLALGIVAFRSYRVTEDMFYIAAKTLSAQLEKKDLDAGTLYPPMANI